MYHISDLKKFLRCGRLYCFSKDVNSVFKPYLRADENIFDLVKRYFGINDCFEGVRNDPADRFFSEIDQYEWFFHPRFTDGEMRVNVPLVHKNGNVFDLYFIYYGSIVRELDLMTYRVTYQIVKRSGLEVGEIFLLSFNGDYVNEGVLDPEKLFICSNTFKKKRIRDLVEREEFDYHSLIGQMGSFDPDAQSPKKCRYCKLNGLCEYYERCFPNEEKEADDSILTLVSSQNKNKMYQDGIRSLKDADPDQLEGNKVQYAQIMASRNGGLFIDRYPLTRWLNRVSGRPISFIDFEWDRYLVPVYKGMKPMDVVCFEFALYYIDEAGHMEHRTFLGTGDCRREFVEALFEYLPDSGPVLAYNAWGAECLRLTELGEMFPEYRDRLESINERFFDLAEPFLEGMIYDVRMQGNFTLKKLVDICSDYSYKDLDIYDGMEAVFNWRDVDKSETQDGEKILENLKEYCSLDAYGLFLVYKWLVKLIIESK